MVLSYKLALLLWAVIGLGPAVLIVGLTVRGLRRSSPECWADMNDAGEVLGWVIPAIAVLSACPLISLDVCSAGTIIVVLIAPIAAFRLAAHLGRIAYWRGRMDPKRLGLGSVLGQCTMELLRMSLVAVCLALLAVAQREDLLLQPGVRLYIALLIASWAGWYLFGGRMHAKDHLPGTWRILAPCQLFSRIRQIASKAGVSMDVVNIATDMPYRWSGGLALGKSEIALTSDLIERFAKEEVDAVVAHEASHAANADYWGLYLPVSGTGLAGLAHSHAGRGDGHQPSA